MNAIIEKYIQVIPNRVVAYKKFLQQRKLFIKKHFLVQGVP